MRSLKQILISIFLLGSLLVQAQEQVFSQEEIYRSEKGYEPAISHKYFRGRNLLYDCIDKHFVCVSNLDYERCQDKRKWALKEDYVLLPCAPLKRLPNQIECFKLNYSLIHEQTYKGFCVSQKKLD